MGPLQTPPSFPPAGQGRSVRGDNTIDIGYVYTEPTDTMKSRWAWWLASLGYSLYFVRPGEVDAWFRVWSMSEEEVIAHFMPSSYHRTTTVPVEQRDVLLRDEKDIYA